MQTVALGVTATLTLARSAGGGWKYLVLGHIHVEGARCQRGQRTLKRGFPSDPMRVSVVGLKESEPAKTIAVTISGDATKA